MNETDKLIEEQRKTLPPNLQQAINAVPWKALVQEIGKENALDAEQIASLEQETMFIIYGFENPNDYVSNITKNIGVSEEIAYTIAESIVDKIFGPISEQSEGYENTVASASVPEIPPTNLPMVEAGEVAHEVPHVQPARQDLAGSTSNQPNVSIPDYRYEGGKDPYREPLK